MLKKNTTEPLVQSPPDLPPHPRCLEFKEVFKKLNKKEDLDGLGPELLNMLRKDGKVIIESDPLIFLEMIKKSTILIESDNYFEIIQEMASIYKEIPQKPQLRPLMQLISADEGCKHVVKYQEKMLELIQVLIEADDSTESRSKCLRALVLHSEFSFISTKAIKWTEKLMSVLRQLFLTGADPNWLSDDYFTIERSTRLTAQFEFFADIPDILLQRKELYSSLNDILPLFLSDTSTDYNIFPGTPLHAMAALNWECNDFTASFFTEYQAITSRLIEHYPKFLDMTDRDGRAPLQAMIEEIRLKEDIFEYVRDVIEMLRTETNINILDCDNQTVLHYLAEAFPVFHDPVSQICEKKFLDLVRSLMSDTNVVVQDNKKRTVLHMLADQYDKDTPEHSHEMFFELIKLFTTQSNFNLKDDEGYTLLDILKEK